MSSSYRPSREGMNQLLNSETMLRIVEERAHAIRSYAELIAPVGPPSDRHAGRYKASFHVRSHTHGGATSDRAEAIVHNDAPEALYVEYGSAGREPYHTMLRAGAEGVRL